MKHRITSVRQLRKEFWAAHPTLPRRKIKDYTGNGKMYTTDVRVAWSNWIDMLKKSGDIRPDLEGTTLS